LTNAETNFDETFFKHPLREASLYRNTFPIPSLLYKKGKKCGKKNDSQYIDYKNSHCNAFRLKDRIELNNKKIDELKANIEVIAEKIAKRINEGEQDIKDREEKIQEKSHESYVFWRDKFLIFIAWLLGKSIQVSEGVINKFFSFIYVSLRNWSGTFAGFVIIVCTVAFIYFIFGSKRRKNNVSSSQSTTSDNIFDYNSSSFKSISNFYPSSISNFYPSYMNAFSSFIDDVSSTAGRIDGAIKELTENLPDDIERENDENSRGADNLYHFNGRDLNISNNVNNYNVNAVYSIYKPTNIIQKNFELQWKKVKQDNKNESKYVLDCQGDDKKEYLESNCSLKIKPEIVEEPIEPEKEKYIIPI